MVFVYIGCSRSITPTRQMTTLVIKMFFMFVRSRAMAGIVCFLCCLGVYHCFIAGLSKPTAGSLQTAADAAIQQSIAELERRNPEAAAELAQMRANHDQVALAATLKTRQQREGVDGLARLSQYRDDPQSPNIYDLRLADIAAKTRFVSNQQRADFILAHGVPMQQHYDLFGSLDVSLSQSPINDYFRTLESAAQDNNLWSRVRENPIMVFLLQQNVDPKLLDFYDAEKDWLDEVLFLVVYNGNADGEGEILTPQDVLQTLHQHHPHFKNALDEALSHRDNDVEMTVCTLYALFANYGSVFRHCVENGPMPVSELLDIVFANPDYFDEHADDRPSELAAKLIAIRDRAPTVWQEAKQRPLYLELYERLPHLANQFSEQYGHYDIALFLFTKYDDSLPAAAAAIDKFGDLAIYILNQYENSAIFREALKSNTHGVRIIPYVARFGDSGLTRFETNRAWLDRYFDEEGNAKEPEWWTYLPGGAVANVARNWANGHPNEWSELGWAAIDVGTAVSFVFTLGGSATTHAAVRGSGTTTKAVGRKAVERTAVTTVARNAAARAASSGTLRTTARPGITSLFRQALLRQAERSMFLSLVARSIDGTIKIAVRIVQITVNLTRTVGTAIYASARNIRAGLTGLPTTTRQAVCRGLFYGGMATILTFRTVPMIKERLSNIDTEKIARQFAQMTTDLGKTAAGSLVTFFDELLRAAGVPERKIGRYIAYFTGIAVLGVGIYFSGRRALFSAART